MTYEKSHDLAEAEFAALGGPKLVYVREISAGDLKLQLSDDEVLQMSGDIDDDTPLYAVHTADGARIAVLNDRTAAFATARTHEMTPVSVH